MYYIVQEISFVSFGRKFSICYTILLSHNWKFCSWHSKKSLCFLCYKCFCNIIVHSSVTIGGEEYNTELSKRVIEVAFW